MRILIAVDNSSIAAEMLPLIVQIAQRASEPPTLLTVIDHAADHPAPPTEMVLAQAREYLKPEAPDVRPRVRIGNPTKEILREAQEGNYDLLIVGGKQRRHSLSRFFLGSAAHRVAEHAPCPVLVVKGQAGPIHNILLCDSGAESPSVGLFETEGTLSEFRARSSLVGRFTARLADLLEENVQITVLHVMSQMSAGPRVEGKQLQASAEELIAESTPEGELLRRDINLLARRGIQSRPKVRHGLVVDEILAEARDSNYDLVIIGAYRGKGQRYALLDDLAHKILAQVDRPVLVVRS